jgi:hypothetical protein
VRSIETVTTPASQTALTTLDRVKLELNITNGNSDALLELKIAEASSDIQAALGFTVARETVAATFWHEAGIFDSLEYLMLDRTPVGSIATVTVDGIDLDASLYRLDPITGQLFALNASGYPMRWYFMQSIVVAYTGGYLLPGQSGRNLPAGIEGAAIDLVTAYWLSRGRDPAVKSETEPGVFATEYWVGAIGEAGELPPSVQMKLAPFRRAHAA